MAEQAKRDAFEVIVIGVGFSGLYMLRRLRQLGVDALVLEAGGGVGGTWYWNRYPGARCDVPSVEYSYSFSPELEREWRWTERYASQPEILAYLDHVADRFDLRKDIRFETRVTAATWDSGRGRWTVTTDAGSTYDAHHVVLATGNLSVPKLPDWPGVERFSGRIVHTAQWPDDVDFAGLRVGLIGTGSSGVQAAPKIAEAASALTIFQRTPSFVVPASNRPLRDEELDELRPGLPALREEARHSYLGFFQKVLGPGGAKEDTPEGRALIFEQAWGAGPAGLLSSYADLLFDEASNAYAADFAREKYAELVADAETARRVTPRGFPFGARRVVSEIGFFDALNRENVELVDVREEPVVEVVPSGVKTARREIPLDLLVLATGFHAMTGAAAAIDIRGRDGRTLASEWADGPRTYLGLAIAGFPNLFLVTGPGSPSVLSNVVVSIEQHVEWITDCINALKDRPGAIIEATERAEADWMDEVNSIAAQTLFPRANSWYQSRTREGKLVFMPYVGGVGTYRERCEQIASAGYAGFDISDSVSTDQASVARAG